MLADLTTLTAFTDRTGHAGINPAVLWNAIENREFRVALRGTSVGNDPHRNVIRVPNGTGTTDVPDAMYPEDLVWAALHHYLTQRDAKDFALQAAAWANENLDPEYLGNLWNAPFVDDLATSWLQDVAEEVGFVTTDGWVVRATDSEGWVVVGHYGEYRSELAEAALSVLR